MRIGIITLPLHVNYGGIMQAFALQYVLRKLGHTSEVIDRGLVPQYSFYVYFYKILRAFAARLIKGCKRPIFIKHYIKKNAPIQERYTSSFVDKYINRRLCRNLYQIKSNEYDAFIVGSDQIWRPMYYRPIMNAYLDFAEDWNVKRVAYAVSFGTDKWEYSRKEEFLCRKLVKKFDLVTVRESQAVDICREHYGINAKHVLDPTMLLTKEEYINIFKLDSLPDCGGEMMIYLLDFNLKNEAMISVLIHLLNLKAFRTNTFQYSNDVQIQPPVENWLKSFMDSKFVVTDSFHACVFSIIFNKDFVVFGNEKRGLLRFHSLLSMFDLEDRLVNEKNINTIALKPIDWEKINEKLVLLRGNSMDVLNEML